MEIWQNDKRVGVVTSGTFSPSINSGIGIGLVETRLYNKDEVLELKNTRGSISIFLEKLPFYKKG
ncbi:MAG: hypothetical protein JJV94_04745 [Sulfurospirillum sp.]|nr:hypothetical protein [Sulfurospirillum sp.]